MEIQVMGGVGGGGGRGFLHAKYDLQVFDSAHTHLSTRSPTSHFSFLSRCFTSTETLNRMPGTHGYVTVYTHGVTGDGDGSDGGRRAQGGAIGRGWGRGVPLDGAALDVPVVGTVLI